MQKRILVGITGASGVVYGIRLLEVLSNYPDVETHLVISKWGKETIKIETEYAIEDVASLADFSYCDTDMAASISSGSFKLTAMVIAPSSMRTVAALANGLADNLIVRSADVCLKERRPVILVPRETPLNSIHLENLLKLSRLGVTILPPMPGFYANPKSIEDIINHTVGKILDGLGIEHDLFKRWSGYERD